MAKNTSEVPPALIEIINNLDLSQATGLHLGTIDERDREEDMRLIEAIAFSYLQQMVSESGQDDLVQAFNKNETYSRELLENVLLNLYIANGGKLFNEEKFEDPDESGLVDTSKIAPYHRILAMAWLKVAAVQLINKNDPKEPDKS